MQLRVMQKESRAKPNGKIGVAAYLDPEDFGKLKRLVERTKSNNSWLIRDLIRQAFDALQENGVTER
jgi:hypothetical protein